MKHLPAALIAVASLAATPAFAFPVTVKSCFDDVKFEKAPERPIVNDANMTQTILDMGLLDRFVGISRAWVDVLVAPPEVLEKVKAKEYSDPYPALEAILGQNPDFYFAGWQYGFSEETGVTPQSLASLGVKSYVLNESCIRIGQRGPISMEIMYADVLALGQIFGVEDRAETMVADFRRRVEDVTRRVSDVSDRPRVMYCGNSCNSDDPPWVIGAEGMPRLLIELAGGENIFDDIKDSYVKASWEDIIDRDPEWLVIMPSPYTQEEVFNYLTTSPNLQNVSAVKNKNFVFLTSPYTEPSTRNVDALEKIARAMFPERFAD